MDWACIITTVVHPYPKTKHTTRGKKRKTGTYVCLPHLPPYVCGIALSIGIHIAYAVLDMLKSCLLCVGFGCSYESFLY